MKIYTKTGDKGTTSLVGGTRIRKNDLRLDTYGTIDELNAHIGVLIALMNKSEVRSEELDHLRTIQHLLFNVGGYLACEEDTPYYKEGCIVVPEAVTFLEQRIDRITEQLPVVHRFTLPQGPQTTAQAHVCRTVCRRAERLICALAEEARVDEVVMTFVNRLSDYLFVVARLSCVIEHGDEFFWEKDCFFKQ